MQNQLTQLLETPEWSFWHKRKKVFLGEALLLMNGIEPHSDLGRQLIELDDEDKVVALLLQYFDPVKAKQWAKSYTNLYFLSVEALGEEDGIVVQENKYLKTTTSIVKRSLQYELVCLDSVRAWSFRNSIPVCSGFHDVPLASKPTVTVDFLEKLKTLYLDQQLRFQKSESGVFLYFDKLPFFLRKLLICFGKAQGEPKLFLNEQEEYRELIAESLEYSPGNKTMVGMVALVTPDEIAETVKKSRFSTRKKKL